jgi:hypothetical protein
MRTMTLRVPDDWRGLVDSWAVQVMLKDFSQSHPLSDLVVDPQPGRARLSLSLPEFQSNGISQSVFLRRLIASYLPALKSFRASQRAMLPPGSHGRAQEIKPRVTERKAAPAPSRVWTERDRLESESGYSPSGAYRIQHFSTGLENAGSSDAERSLPILGEISPTTLILAAIVAVLFVVLLLSGIGKSKLKTVGGTPVQGYKP